MRIAIILGTLVMGGAERQALRLGTYLAARGRDQVAVFGPGAVQPAVAEAAAGLPLTVLPGFESRRVAVCAARMLRAAWRLRHWRPDLLLPYTWPANVMCGLYREVTGARWLLWNQRDEGLGRTAPHLERLAARNCTGFAANSPGGANFLTKTLGIIPTRVSLVPNAVELPPPTVAPDVWRKRLAVPPGRPLAVMVANIQHHKDHATLLRAWARLPTSRPVLVLAGTPGDSAAAMRNLAADLGIADDVRWAGTVTDLAGLLATADLGVFASLTEGCPNGLLEMLAAGLPVAASDIPGVRFALGAEPAGLLLPPGDDAAWATAVARLCADAHLRRSLADAGRQRIAAAFAPELALAAAEAAIAAATYGQWRTRSWP
jgi:glycosyltransferase involved in cell wall biosynthesis